MKVVFDTNIWLSAIFWDGEANKIVKKALNKKIEILISKEILSEVVEVLNKEKKFIELINEKRKSIEDLIRMIIISSNLIDVKTRINLIKEHEKDNIILELALDGKADYIVSYDKHILNMLEFREIKILSPREFSKISS